MTESASKNHLSEGPVDLFCRLTPRCIIHPFRFFVSWQGVLTLAYSGFPPAILDLKHRIASLPGIPQEYNGSKWPKTSLACLRDNCRLTPEMYKKLNDICKEESKSLLISLGNYQEFDSNGDGLVLDSLSSVFYECRCLERRLLTHVTPLDSSLPLDERPVSEEEHANLLRVISSADEPDYWFHVSRDGSREAHYKGSALGLTLVHELRLPERMMLSKDGLEAKSTLFQSLPKSVRDSDLRAAVALSSALQSFRQQVETEFGSSLYTWFTHESLHVTVRSLMG
eukprot:CAMPEP_0175066552 /NCGR_PEP_ID=MMETSP0052_2-20121109/16573_1 /TAXON_ID=51329 ORGANISM="Polytomella parva, Strain SAG 63-3" /NCGR_SAMPLE_ID=MMETSP0052_2 /ASSEMBLY_ACC=CAM_ASM_000194 /LENGTH=282 /DNA_ID=CAMNT_0016333269 /DNA_START=99 /DNA_END=947 /DNA_ORIENTATION=-